MTWISPAAPPVWENPRTVLITGATGGIGSALARCYAEPGRTLILHGRNPVPLMALVRDCEARGATVLSMTFDLRASDAALKELRSVSQRLDIDLVIVNAGVTKMIGAGEQLESLAEAKELLEVNLDGALATVAGVLPRMRRRQRGQIALVSSLAAYMGIPQAPVYCASKAALKAYGESLRAWLRPRGVVVSTVLLGFVRTRMTEQFTGPTPMLVSPDHVALRIRRDLERNRGRIVYPRTLGWGLQCLSLLPAPLAERLMSVMGYRA